MLKFTRIPTRNRSFLGLHLVFVPLANTDKRAVIDEADFDRLIEAGLSDQWVLNKADLDHYYVRTPCSKTGNLVTIARLIVDADPGQAVGYKDGDRLNLRRTNLYIKKAKYAKHGSPFTNAEKGAESSGSQPVIHSPLPIRPILSKVRGTAHAAISRPPTAR